MCSCDNERFVCAVRSVEDIANGLCSGLRALGANSSVVEVDNTRKLNGSVDIDSCTRDKYPSAARWDYVVGYDNKAYFLEVHPANTSNVDEMIQKSLWLRQWLRRTARALENIKASEVLYWVPSGRYAILPNSPQNRRLAQSKILLVRKLKIG